MMGPSDMRCVPAVGVPVGDVPAMAVLRAAAQDRDVAVVPLAVPDLVFGEGEVGRLAFSFGGVPYRVVNWAHRGDALAASVHAVRGRGVGRKVGK